MDLIITILPVVTKDLPISPRFTPYNFLSRCKFSNLTTRQPMVEFYLLTFPRFPLRKKEHKSYFGKNRTHDFRTSRCAAYLLDHSGDEPTWERLNERACAWEQFDTFCEAIEQLPTTLLQQKWHFSHEKNRFLATVLTIFGLFLKPF